MLHLGILGSTRGTNLAPIVEAIQNKQLAAQIEVVFSNKFDAPILARAQSYHLPTAHLSSAGLTRENFDKQVSTLLRQYHVDVIVLIGYMRIISPQFVSEWKNKIINVHPSLLPAFAGLMDLDVHRAVIASGKNETGCTVHYVTEEVDAGPILLQKKCLVMEKDTPEILKERVQQLEGLALVEAIDKISFK